MTHTEACLALNLIPQIGPVRLARLLEHFGTPQAVLRAKAAQILAVPGIDEKLAEAVVAWESSTDLSGELRKIAEHRLSILTQEDPLYPPLLRETPGAPFLLYVWGRLEPGDHRAIGIVGSRQATHYGLNTAKRLSFQLAFAGYTVVSGLARGIDTAAHEAALAAKGRTLAVIGSGIGRLYPPENQALAERIADGHGAVLSEYPVDRLADRQTFPYRNRIVAGWSNGLLVIEAPGRSGSLITAQQALDCGRPVFAVPGPIDKPTSLGCNRLIQQGAKLVIDGTDILDELSPGTLAQPELFSVSDASSPPAAAVESLSLEERILYEALGQGAEPSHIDELIARSGLTPATVSATLMRLEMKRLLKPLPGRHYVRL